MFSLQVRRCTELLTNIIQERQARKFSYALLRKHHGASDELLRGRYFLGQLSLDVTGRISLTIHTKQKPAIETQKWGAWGEGYNVIAIELIGIRCSDIAIRNWKGADNSLVVITKENDKRVLRQRGRLLEYIPRI